MSSTKYLDTLSLSVENTKVSNATRMQQTASFLTCIGLTFITREGFLRKNIVVVSLFKTVLYSHILNTCLNN